MKKLVKTLDSTRIEYWSEGCEPDFQLEAVVVQSRPNGNVYIIHERCDESRWQWHRISLNRDDARVLIDALRSET